MFSVIYTPTEGEAIANYSRLFRRPEGCFLNINDQDSIEDNLDQWGAPDDIDLVVVSDGEQVSDRCLAVFPDEATHCYRFWGSVIRVLELYSSQLPSS